ncbi:hypothetical protein M3T53_08725 [Actinomyces sp. B33]|uniref:hypothetical protein n=1 Tax=Actinomyces sp. B33 TaxID=2942131 RepID=UPI002340E25B|nr:hypothetical protein [Actinomyces sp. B33]MDC4233785.1 hypothetical protein [Actinomyces sp. B33]
MLATVLSHELRAQAKNDLRTVGILLLFAGGFTIVGLFAGGFFVGAGLVLLLIPVALLAQAAADYWQTMYGARGYWTMSLPVRGRDLYLAKTIRAFLSALVGSLVTVAGLTLVALVGIWRTRLPYDEVVRGFETMLRISTDSAAIVLLLAGLVSLFCLILQVSAAMTIGAEARWNRYGIGAPIVICVLMYVFSQVVSVVSMLFVPVAYSFDENRIVIRSVGSELLTGASGPVRVVTDESPSSDLIGVAPSVLAPIIAVGFAWWAIRSIENRTSLR